MRGIALLCGLLLWSGAALAQNQTPVYQSGSMTPGHAAKFLTNGIIGDAGPAGGGAPGVGLTELGITNSGTPFCINDGPIVPGAGYHQLCLGALSLGGGLLSYNPYGTASPLPFDCLINGVFIANCFSGGGGPSAANPTAQVGAAVVNGSAATFMRSDAAPPLDTTGVVATTYGDSTHVPQFAVDANGRIHSVTNVAISGGSATPCTDANTSMQYDNSGAFGCSPMLYQATGSVDAPDFLTPIPIISTYTVAHGGRVGSASGIGIVPHSVSGGTSTYAPGDIVTTVGGTGTEPTFTVVSVDGSNWPSVITPATVGAMTVLPADPVHTTGGSGTGLQLNFGVAWQWQPAIESGEYDLTGMFFNPDGNVGLTVGYDRFWYNFDAGLFDLETYTVDSYASPTLAITPLNPGSASVLSVEGLSQAPLFQFGSADGSATTPTATPSGRDMGAIQWFGNNGGGVGYGGMNEAVDIFATAAENFDSSHSAASLILSSQDSITDDGTLYPRISINGTGDSLLQNGHLTLGGGTLDTAPMLTSCGGGTPSLNATASDTEGVVTEGTTSTGCTITFARAFTTAPVCTVSGSDAYTHAPASTTALVVANASISGDTFSYRCTE